MIGWGDMIHLSSKMVETLRGEDRDELVNSGRMGGKR
jgi:hypothetical protein